MQTTEAGAWNSTTDQRRELAIKRLKAKSDFKQHLLAYVAVNTMLIVIWAFTSAGQPWPRGIFWPIFPIVGWGVGLVIHGYVTYRGQRLHRREDPAGDDQAVFVNAKARGRDWTAMRRCPAAPAAREGC